MSFGSFLNKGVLTTGPAHWKPWAVWDAYRGITTATGVSEWADTVQGFRFEQGATSQQPELTQDTSEFNNKKYLSFDESTSEFLTLSTTDVPLEDQRFFHDGYTSWRMSFVFTPRNIGGGVQPLIGTSVMPTTGIRTDYRDKDGGLPERITFYIGNDSSSPSVFLEGVTQNVPHLIDCEFDHIAEEIRIRKNGGEWNTTDTSSFTYSSGDPGGSLRLANYGGGGAAFANLDIAHLFITKTLPSTQTSNDMLDWYGKYFAFKNPELWGLTWLWDGDKGVDTSVTDVWTDQQSGVHLQQATSANRPSYNATDPDWNNHGSLTPDGTDYLQIDETQVPRGDQTFFHDNSKSWFAYVVFEADSGANSAIISTQSSHGFNTGISVITRDSSQGGFMRMTQYNGSTSDLAQSPNDSIHENENNIAFLQYDNVNNELGIRVNGGPWVKSTVTQTPDTGNSGAPLTIMAAGDGSIGYDGAVTHFGVIEGSLPSPMQQEIMLDYFLDRYVAKFPLTANGGAYTPENVVLSGSNVSKMRDLSGNGNHILPNPLGAVNPALDSTTYRGSVLDFDGTESLQLPVAFESAVTGTVDAPLTVIIGFRSPNDGDWWMGVGVNGVDYALQLRNQSLDEVGAYRSDGTTSATPRSDAVFPDSEWHTLGFYVEDGTTAKFVEDGGIDAGSAAFDIGSATTAGTTEGRLGSRSGNSGGEYEGQIGRIVLDSQDLKGMARAKMQRWVHSYTSKL